MGTDHILIQYISNARYLTKNRFNKNQVDLKNQPYYTFSEALLLNPTTNANKIISTLLFNSRKRRKQTAYYWIVADQNLFRPGL